MSAGAEPIEGNGEIEACDDKPVLMVVDGLTNDRSRMRAYTEALLSSGLYEALGGYYVNDPRALASFEGRSAPNHSTLIIRFPCLANARTFWYSRAYQEEIKPLRLNPLAGDFRVRIFAEVPPATYMRGKVEAGRYRERFASQAIEVLPFPPGDDAADDPAPNMRRTTLVVANLDRALALYRDVFAFDASAPRLLASDASARMIFSIPDGEPVRFVSLDAGDAQREILGLIEVPSYRPQRHGVRPAAVVIKVPVLLETILPRVTAAGATLMRPTMAGANKEQALLDADGNLIVLYELPR
jgi:catechol 2,3-dioxygenase-like lactoylglutathione lyase family enzyme/uncharacterized protein (DUF1330 family)